VPDNARDIAEPNTILRVLAGSEVHGTNLPGSSDHDELGVCIPPKTHVLGIATFEQWEHRTAAQGTRSGPGDIDVTVYALAKFCRLAAAGNPSILLPLFVPDEHTLVVTDEGRLLRDHAHLFWSRAAGHRFLGYLTSQRDKMLGVRGNRTKRPELVAEHGYDTKFAGHAVRLGYQGVEFLETGRLTLPMGPVARESILAVRRGQHELADVIDLINAYTVRLRVLVKDESIPYAADRQAISDLMIRLCESWWSR